MTKLYIVVNLYNKIVYTGTDQIEAFKAWNEDYVKHKKENSYLIAMYEINIELPKNNYYIKFIDGTGWLD